MKKNNSFPSSYFSKKIIPNAGWIFIIFLFAIFLKPYFVDKLVPIPTALLVNNYSPWNVHSEFSGPVQNPALSDVVTQIIPWRMLTIAELKKGEFPLWNEFSFSGTPHLANYQSSVFNPLNILFFIFPFIDAWSILIFLQVILSFIGTYLFLRYLSLEVKAALLGSIAFSFSGFMTVWLPYGTLSLAISYLPWGLYFTSRYFKTSSWLSLGGVSLSVIFSFFAGHFQTSLYLFVVLFCYGIFQFIDKKQVKKLLFFLFALLVGALISLLQIYPTIVLYMASSRSNSISQDIGIPWNYLITLFAPDFFGNPVTRNDWVGYYAERAGYMGIIPLIFSFLSLFHKERKVVMFFGLIGLASLLFALDSPLNGFMKATQLPIIATSINTRIIVIFSFSFSVLSAFGFSYFSESLNKRLTILKYSPFIIVTILFIGIWLLLLLGNIFDQGKTAIAIRNLILPTVLILFIGVGIIGVKIMRMKKLYSLFFIGILLFTAFDSYRFVSKWLPFESRQDFYPSIQVLEKITDYQKQGKVYGPLGLESAIPFNIRLLGGYDPLFFERYGEFIESANGIYKSPKRVEAQLDPRAKYADRVLELLGVTMIYQPKNFINQLWAYPVWEKGEKFTRVYEDEKNELYVHNNAFPPARLYFAYEIDTERKSLLKRFYSDDFDYKNIVLVENQIVLNSSEASGSSKVLFSKISNNQFNIDVESPKDAVLFTSLPYSTSWKATVNGDESNIFPVNHAFIGLIVPKGKSEVRLWFTYP